jgi:hypothetical protein
MRRKSEKPIYASSKALNKTILARRRATAFRPGRKGKRTPCYGERLVGEVLTNDMGDVAPAVLPVRMSEMDFREKIQART